MTHSKHTYVESRKQWSHKGWGHIRLIRHHHHYISISSFLCFCFLSLVGIWDPATTHPHVTPLKRDRNFFLFPPRKKLRTQMKISLVHVTSTVAHHISPTWTPAPREWFSSNWSKGSFRFEERAVLRKFSNFHMKSRMIGLIKAL